MTMTRSRFWLVRVIPTACALLVATAAFTLSFEAIRDVAIRVAAVPEHLAWMLPLCIDGAVLAASATAWAASLQGKRMEPAAVLTAVFLLVLSVCVNMDHAGPSLMAKTLAAVPPLSLLACLELVAGAYRRSARESDAAATVAAGEATARGTVPHASGEAPADATRDSADTSAKATPWEPVAVPIDDTAMPPVTAVPTAAARPAQAASTVHVTTTSRPARVRRPAGENTIDGLRRLLGAHVDTGGDPLDPTLSARFAADLGISPATARKNLGSLRRELAATELTPSAGGR